MPKMCKRNKLGGFYEIKKNKFGFHHLSDFVDFDFSGNCIRGWRQEKREETHLWIYLPRP
jgi:hypothetical protein